MFSIKLPKIRAIRPDDPDFIISDGLMITPRAGFEISNKCPERYKLMIMECIEQGWLSTVAYQPVHEEFMEKLTNAN
jgi:hypothetical protein